MPITSLGSKSATRPQAPWRASSKGKRYWVQVSSKLNSFPCVSSHSVAGVSPGTQTPPDYGGVTAEVAMATRTGAVAFALKAMPV